MADHRRAPLYEALIRHVRKDPVRFHVPGHKGGKGLDPESTDFFERIMTLDLTELEGLDDLHAPRGAILEAERLAADCFGAEETLFLVNGSTAGNLALILSLCNQGDLMLVQRNVHKSVIHGLMLAGARAVFLPVQWDETTNLPGGVRIRDVEAALHAYPEAKGVFVTNPNYYGVGTDLEGLARRVHAHGKPLLVDEAHGAHFGFHRDLPPSALSSGADGVVQSTHKMLGALTMGAMLHLQGSRLDRDLLKQRLSMLQTSSPSYPIMASLDLCRRRMALEGEKIVARGLAVVGKLVAALKEYGWLRVDCPFLENPDSTRDPFKLVIRDATGTLTGYELQRELETEGCFAEMADPEHVLFALSPFSCEYDADRLRKALNGIQKRHSLAQKPKKDSGAAGKMEGPGWNAISPPVEFGLSLKGEVMAVPLEESVGLRAAEMIIPYPPGIPLLYPGEAITEQTAAFLRHLSEAGAKFQGPREEKLKTVRVFLPDST